MEPMGSRAPTWITSASNKKGPWSALIIGSGPKPEKTITVKTAQSILLKVNTVVKASFFHVFLIKGKTAAIKITASA